MYAYYFVSETVLRYECYGTQRFTQIDCLCMHCYAQICVAILICAVALVLFDSNMFDIICDLQYVRGYGMRGRKPNSCQRAFPTISTEPKHFKLLRCQYVSHNPAVRLLKDVFNFYGAVQC